MKYRINFTLFDTLKEARKSPEFAEHKAIQSVRPLVMSDFVVWPNLLGDIREKLAELIGDDSQMDSGPLFDAIRSGALEAELRKAFDKAAKDIPLEGWVVVEELE